MWRPALAAGSEIAGPAVIEEPSSTTLIGCGDQAAVTESGIFDYVGGLRSMKPSPVTVEVVRNAVNAYADEMARALCKSAYNMMIYEVRDFCWGLIDCDGRMISQNRGGLPIFLADLGIAVKDGIARHGLDGFAPGDVVIMNHGLVCGQHLNNVVVYAPAFMTARWRGRRQSRSLGRHRGQADRLRLGRDHGDLSGGPQLRSLKIYEAGKRNETLWQIINDNLRFPEAALGDLRAQIACCQLRAPLR